MSFMLNAARFAEALPAGIQLVGYHSATWANASAPTITFATDLTWAADTEVQIDDVVVVAYATSDLVSAAPDPTLATAGYAALHATITQTDVYATRLRTFYKRMGPTPDASVIPSTLSGDKRGAVAVMVLRGVHLDITDAAAVTTGGTNGNVVDPAAITPATAGAWIMAIGLGTGSAGTPASMDYQTSVNGSAGGGHAELTLAMGLETGWTSGAYDPAAWTGAASSTNDSWCAATLAFKLTDVTTPPTFTVDPVIASNNGFVGDGDTFTATPGTADGQLVGYEWLLDGLGTGDTDLSYTAGPGDVSKVLTFAQTHANGLGQTSRQSNALGPIVTPSFATANRKTSDGNDRLLSNGDTRITTTRTA